MEKRAPSMPFVGGINSAQIQTMDTNGDGKKEWVLWDINARNILVFEKDGTSFKHLPEMPHYFPEDIQGFLILKDFDNDGLNDLFTSSPFGIKAYQNAGIENGHPIWKVAQDFLPLENGSNIQANNLDIPALQDIDEDGDLDLVTFNYAEGDYLDYFKNTSMERKGQADIDGFAPSKVRWGNFEFCGCGYFSFGQTCDGDPINKVLSQSENQATKHFGGHSILLKDFNKDGLLDLLMGQDECNILYFLPNAGTNETPIFNSFYTNLPGLAHFPQFPIYHVAHSIQDQLIITSNTSSTTISAGINFRKSLIQLENQNGTWQEVTDRFLQEQMIDLGENSRPHFKGNHLTGELVVTTNNLVGGESVGQASLFHLNQASLQLEENDYLSLSSLHMTELQYLEIPSPGKGILLSGVETEDHAPKRKLFWFSGDNLDDLTEISVPGISLGILDHFEYYLEGENHYLLLARQTGELIRFQVETGKTPKLTLLDRSYLDFRDNPASRNLSVKVIRKGNQLNLYAVDQEGILSYIPNFTQSNATKQSQILKLKDESLTETRFGRHTWISAIPNAFDGKTDLILGNTAGGLIYLKDISSSQPFDSETNFHLFPNPTKRNTKILSNMDGPFRVINTVGQVLLVFTPLEAGIAKEIDTLGLPHGIYFIQLRTANGKIFSQKLILSP
ncbi:T9SS type A sorting domain-containing protein [Echinicola jeungdonensis]|uniref:T9SS type A sorting domain-containing protein n=1 Tax=Echinicola jeungdonensis TaxID=709343 RepID=A0ABV5JAE6_9BACT|nr:T9SS type A sorting domain-containing protein [Echinicola jeungdonensis]MDN3669646.1 T9SS type A sorting domain-containing protein [Echinicola jeungdonensis]